MVDAPERAFPRALVAALALSAMLSPLNSTMLSVVLTPIGREFDTGDAYLTQLLVTSYLITSIVMQAPGGKLGDRLGHRHALGLGQLAFLLGSLGAFIAPSENWLGLARVVMASGGALIVPSASALLRLELPPDKRGRAFGMFGSAMALSAAIGPPLGGFIAGHFGWRATFLVNLAVLPVAAGLARFGHSPHGPSPSLRGFRFDGVGSLLLGAALTAVVVGARLEGALRWGTLAAGGAGVMAFYVWERRHPEPVVDLSLLTRPVFVAGGMVVALQNLAMYALLFELPIMLGKLDRPEPVDPGPLLGALMVSMVVASPIAGRLADHFGARPIAVSGCLSTLAGLGVLFVTPVDQTTRLIPGLVCLGLGLGLSSSPSQASAMTASPRESSGVAGALLATLRYLGGVLGIVLLGLVLHDDATGAVAAHDHTSALTCFGVALVGALGCALVLPGKAPPTTGTATRV
ncbi:MAG: MFS transporter [Polyangiales bacterium]